MRDYVLIYVNGRRHEIRGPRVYTSLSDFLRVDLHLTGTKVVCAEGDCGSCTVMLGRVENDSLSYRTVCSCIQMLYQLDGLHVITVEGLKVNGQLNVVQESMVKNHGSQCGFCTPGFIVSMCAMHEHIERPTEADVRRNLVGNLCRCTGYEAIIKASLQVEKDKFESIHKLYDSRAIAADLKSVAGESILIKTDRGEVFKPATLKDACEYRSSHPDVTLINGGTDLGVLINKNVRQINHAMSLSGLDELRFVKQSPRELIVGAGCSIAQLEEAAAESIPEYGRLLVTFGSPPIKNAGTVGGNIANGSPIADTIPALYALDAQIELVSTSGSRRVSMNSFYTGYKKNVMRKDELIHSIIIPIPPSSDRFKLYKVSKRLDLDISTFTAAFWMRVDGSTIVESRLAMGGVGPNIIRLTQTEQFLAGQSLTESVFEQAGKIARSEIKPISDVRGSADYRLQLGENILRKFYFDTAFPDGELIAAGNNGHSV